VWVTTALRHATDRQLPLPLVARSRWRTLGADVAFNTLTFMLFFAVILAVHQLPLSWRARKRNLLIASYVFYSAWNPPLILLLWISTAIDWWAAQRIAASETRSRRRRFLFASLSANLGLLFFFKYGDFLVENFTMLMKLLGVSYQPAAPSIVLPLGISFYTLQTLSYTIDIYRGQRKPWNSFLDYALYVSFFPQLVAGPIVRAGEFLPQCVEPRRADAWQLNWGLSFLTLGLFQKIVLADGVFSRFVEAVYDSNVAPSFWSAWVGTAAFAGQVYCDFAGYSACAIGTAACLGFRIPDNFRCPYAAVGVRDLWRRWHISLSTWVRDYVYFSLGGNRGGLARELFNLMITFVVIGLWHGASWHFAIFGAFHGLLVCGERVLSIWFGAARIWSQAWMRVLLGVVTFALWCLLIPFFRAEVVRGVGILSSMLGFGTGDATMLPPESGAFDLGLMLFCLFCLIGVQWMMRDASLEAVTRRCPWVLHALLLAFAWVAIVLMPGTDRGFIYFLF
jgi:D-alanyl-lipoteichoic acid acyltransferase DltB (MBOAT superfamily)